ncbi:MAG: pyridoxamine 5'-phosphate oxidase [Myxococcota bacterium]
METPLRDLTWTDATEPFGLFDAWFTDAEATEPDVPNAMQLATVDGSGQPTLRTVLLKGVSPEGLRFFTNLESRKGRDLAANPRAALLFHWKTSKRQVKARGPVERLSDEASDAYWATRPRGSQLAAWASAQSRPLASAEAYEEAVAEATTRFEGQDVPRPPFWAGFRLVPLVMEFWEDGEYRMHTRLQFERETPTAPWTKGLLQP